MTGVFFKPLTGDSAAVRMEAPESALAAATG